MAESFSPAVPILWSRLDSPSIMLAPSPKTFVCPPPRPPAWQERLGRNLLLFLSPPLSRTRTSDPPRGLAPFERFEIERSYGRGNLSALWYPAKGEICGAVLLAHPWLHTGQAFFYQRGRLRALRRAGLHALTFDFGGIGQSGPTPRGFHDRDLTDAFAALKKRVPDLPLHLWGVSAGGYWAHLLLSRPNGFRSAFFEDVSPHLIEWSKRIRPRALPFYLFFQNCLPSSYRFLDLRRHAACLHLGSAAYLSGGLDRGVLPEETRELAGLADAERLLVERADHLGAIRIAQDELLRLALRAFGSSSQDPIRKRTF